MDPGQSYEGRSPRMLYVPTTAEYPEHRAIGCGHPNGGDGATAVTFAKVLAIKDASPQISDFASARRSIRPHAPTQFPLDAFSPLRFARPMLPRAVSPASQMLRWRDFCQAS